MAETKKIPGKLEVDTICFDKNEELTEIKEIDNKECFYTFYVYDDNWEVIDNSNLYTNSIYKEIFDEALVPYITPDEVLNMISEKEKNLGVTDEIKEGAEIKWNFLSGNIFSDYVGR